jgi:Ca-activated chloride channel homolog
MEIHHMATEDTGAHPNPNGQPDLSLEMRPERRLIGTHGSFRHVDFLVRVASAARRQHADRSPLAISLVLDRSGSMHGDKIATARQAALAVLEQLDDRDRVAAVVFDDHIDVLQQAAPATAEVRARLRAELARVEARGRTALHEGWLTGCTAIAADGPETARLTRCFLLTDGLANVGVTDSEQIASEAAGVRANAAVGTSTFGIGLDYNEGLLGPMAVAGGGQFHHLRGPAEIARTFLGELGELLAVAVRDVRLEIQGTSGATAEMISPYWMQQSGDGGSSWSVTLGDLLGGEDRHVVVRFGFMTQLQLAGHLLRARLVWVSAAGLPMTGDWRELSFEYADYALRRAEPVQLDVQRVVGVQHAERAQRIAIERSRNGDVAGARQVLDGVARRIAEYAGDDSELLTSIAELRRAEADLSMHGYAPAMAKETYFASQSRSRGQRDLRGPRE